MSESATHHPPESRHAADLEWEMGRFGNVTKFLFHPRPERPTEPNAGFLKYAPGASFPLHWHDFAQVWYIIDGEFTFAGKLYGPGTIAYMADPHFEHEMHTATGGAIPRSDASGRIKPAGLYDSPLEGGVRCELVSVAADEFLES